MRHPVLEWIPRIRETPRAVGVLIEQVPGIGTPEASAASCASRSHGGDALGRREESAAVIGLDILKAADATCYDLFSLVDIKSDAVR